MGSSVPFYAVSEDESALVAHAASLELAFVPAVLQPGSELADLLREPLRFGLCYFAVDPPNRLHPYGDPPLMVSQATDALIEFHRSRLEGDSLTIGRIYWSDDVPEFAKRTKAPFGRLRAWIKANWQRRDNYWIGPGAVRVVEHGVRLAGIGISVTRIDPKSGKRW